jgi:flagellar hook-basal body protein
MAFFTALTGIHAANSQLAATSNNIANAATTGFKRSTTNFGDIFASSPLQKSSSTIGQGVALKGVTQDFSQGNLTFSSDTLNLAISGSGFFPMKSPDGLQSIYTRNGTFMLNNENTVVNAAGQQLMAASVDSAGNADISNMNPLNIPSATVGEAKQTTQIQLGLNFPASAAVITKPFDKNDPSTYNESTAMNVYDGAGNSYLATVYYAKTQNASAASPANKWQTYVYVGNTLVSSALQQSTDSTGSAQYVNQYGQIANAAQVGDQLTNSKTEMFNLDNLTNTQSSSAATVSGTLAPNLGSLSSDVINFQSPTTVSGIVSSTGSPIPLFDISVDGSKTVPINIADLAGQNLQLHGSDIATELTNRINQTFGSQKYFDFSGTNNSSVNLELQNGSGSGSSMQNIPLNLGSGNETYQTVVNNINSQLQAAAANTPASTATIGGINFSGLAGQSMTLKLTLPNNGGVEPLSIPSTAQVTDLQGLINYVNYGNTAGTGTPTPQLPGFSAVASGPLDASGKPTAVKFVSSNTDPMQAAIESPTYASLTTTNGTTSSTYTSKVISVGGINFTGGLTTSTPFTLNITSGTAPSSVSQITIPTSDSSGTPLNITTASQLVNYLNTGNTLTSTGGTSILPANLVASVGLDGSTINFGSTSGATPIPSQVTLANGIGTAATTTYSSTAITVPGVNVDSVNNATQFNITIPANGTAAAQQLSFVVPPQSQQGSQALVAYLNGANGLAVNGAPGLVAVLGEDEKSISFSSINSSATGTPLPTNVSVQSVTTATPPVAVAGAIQFTSASTQVNEIGFVGTSSSTVNITTSAGISTITVPSQASDTIEHFVDYLNTGLVPGATTPVNPLPFGSLGLFAVANSNGTSISFENVNPVTKVTAPPMAPSLVSITTGSGTFSSAVTCSYDPVAQQFNFTPTNSNQTLTLNGAIVNGAPVANTLFGLSTGSLTQSSTSTSLNVSASAEGGYIMDLADQRYGITVAYDSVNQRFNFSSGTTGDKSSISISNPSPWAQTELGLASADANGNSINYTVTPTTVATRGLQSTPATMTGGDIGVNVNNSFSVNSTNNKFVVLVGSVQGTVTVPPSNDYTLGSFMQALQDGINHLSGPPSKPGLTGQTVSGVTVSYDATSNALVFKTGTQGANSYIKVSGDGTWGLANTTGARGADSTWIKPTQATVVTNGVAVPQYIDQYGNETSSPDGFSTLPAWSPIYLGKGELTFNTSGSLESPLAGAKLNTVYLPNGAGSLTMSIDYSKSTQNSAPYAVLSESQDGAPEGDLTGVSIGNDGLVTASYSNSTQANLGKIVLANFANPSGLTQIGDTNFYASSSSGTVKYGQPGSAGYGTVKSGATENANVDMTTELVNMITEQRNFQANAKAISTNTTLTQTIIQIQA